MNFVTMWCHIRINVLSTFCSFTFWRNFGGILMGLSSLFHINSRGLIGKKLYLSGFFRHVRRWLGSSEITLQWLITFNFGIFYFTEKNKEIGIDYLLKLIYENITVKPIVADTYGRQVRLRWLPMTCDNC